LSLIFAKLYQADTQTDGRGATNYAGPSHRGSHGK